MNINEISEAFSSKLRLAIISSLVNQNMVFSDLKEATGATDGNLSVQLKKLNNWGFINTKKVRYMDKLLTSYSLTKNGKTEFENYVLLLESILKKEGEEKE
ncbi:transcriptional regulator [Jeotgalibaca ciconiae]|uniref:ArsR family transcriptional regulator n=1 Tax=Jeotgalibaca ciconiae TaxID=2496265 RepID=A0A3S9HDI8_9LACT|nr:transcriptional regulator [Jeotgalibaca ciconiae]AZP05407.1 ArsR family transcriptional regulator [Jeotgalibaca ciconiae]